MYMGAMGRGFRPRMPRAPRARGIPGGFRMPRGMVKPAFSMKAARHFAPRLTGPMPYNNGR